MIKKLSESNKKELLKAFAKTVRRRRHELNLTQEELAERADLHVNYIGGIERAQRNPTLLIIIQLAKALDFSPKSFFLD